MSTFMEKTRMNLKLIQWLLANQTTLLKIAEVAKGWSNDLSYEDRWAIVDSIARLVIPLIKAANVSPKALCENYDVVYDESGRVTAMSLPDQKEVAEAMAHSLAIAIDWKTLVEVIIPLVIKILQLIADRSE